jgi:hypothetical protein
MAWDRLECFKMNNDLHNSLLTMHSENVVNIAITKDGLIWKSFISHHTLIRRETCFPTE